MKKTTLATTMALVLGCVATGSTHAANMTSATFTMYAPDGVLIVNEYGALN